MDLKNDPAIQGHEVKMESMHLQGILGRGAGTWELSSVLVLLDPYILIDFYGKASAHKLLEFRKK